MTWRTIDNIENESWHNQRTDGDTDDETGQRVIQLEER